VIKEIEVKVEKLFGTMAKAVEKGREAA